MLAPASTTHCLRACRFHRPRSGAAPSPTSVSRLRAGHPQPSPSGWLGRAFGATLGLATAPERRGRSAGEAARVAAARCATVNARVSVEVFPTRVGRSHRHLVGARGGVGVGRRRPGRRGAVAEGPLDRRRPRPVVGGRRGQRDLAARPSPWPVRRRGRRRACDVQDAGTGSCSAPSRWRGCSQTAVASPEESTADGWLEAGRHRRRSCRGRPAGVRPRPRPSKSAPATRCAACTPGTDRERRRSCHSAVSAAVGTRPPRRSVQPTLAARGSEAAATRTGPPAGRVDAMTAYLAERTWLR